MDAHEIVLRHALTQKPVAADFEMTTTVLPSRLPDGAVLVEALCLSLDPYLGSRLRGRHMGEPAPAPGARMPGYSVARVVDSASPAFATGDWVLGEIGWSDLAIVDGSGLRKVSNDVPAAAHLSVLGMPGLTAWAGVTQLLKISAGDVFLVDAALGPVGATAGQIAKRLGAKVIGIAGGADKCATLIDTLNFDSAIDRRAADFLYQLKAAIGPDGITAHFENVGLSVLSPALTLLRPYGRVVLCGMVEHYHSDSPPQIPTGIIIGKRATIHGLVVYDFASRQDEWVTMATAWLQDGSLKMVLDASLGLASAPAQFERLMNGTNHGKAMVTIAQDAA